MVDRWEEKGGVCFNRLQMARSKQFSVVNDGSPVTELETEQSEPISGVQ